MARLYIYVSNIFHIQTSWYILLNVYDFYFWYHDTATEPFFFIRDWKVMCPKKDLNYSLIFESLQIYSPSDTSEWLELSIQSELGKQFEISCPHLAFHDFAFFKHSS